MIKKAFTLVECLFTLVIMTLIVVLVSLQMTVIKSSTRQLDKPLDWYLCLTELESADHHFIIDQVSRRILYLVSEQSGLTYELRATDRLYLRSTRGGYLLLFNDAKPGSITFKELPNSRVRIQGERKNGQEIQGVVKFYGKVSEDEKQSTRVRTAN